MKLIYELKCFLLISLLRQRIYFQFFKKYLYHKKLKDSATIQDYVKQQHRRYFPHKSIYTVLNENYENKLKYPSNF